MTFCDFSSGICHCGFDVDRRSIPRSAIRVCENASIVAPEAETPTGWSPPNPPNIAQQAWSLAAAILVWTAAGRPKRTDDEVARILATCQSCRHFKPIDDSHGQCLLCGCGCSTDYSALTNKLRMATEHCPDDPPRW